MNYHCKLYTIDLTQLQFNTELTYSYTRKKIIFFSSSMKQHNNNITLKTGKNRECSRPPILSNSINANSVSQLIFHYHNHAHISFHSSYRNKSHSYHFQKLTNKFQVPRILKIPIQHTSFTSSFRESGQHPFTSSITTFKRLIAYTTLQ